MNDEIKLEPAELTAEERELVAWFRKLDEKDQANLIKMVRTKDTPSAKRFRTVMAILR